MESIMAGKNKGGREVRKPKQDKKPKASTQSTSVVPPSAHPAKAKPSK
ncbi:MAG: hypothetical protein ABR604_09835 [Jatrophihabitantaceae bacterium]